MMMQLPLLHEVLSARSRHQPTWKLATLSKPTRLVIHLFIIHLNYTMKKHIQRTRRWIVYNAVGKRNRKICRESFSQVGVQKKKKKKKFLSGLFLGHALARKVPELQPRILVLVHVPSICQQCTANNKKMFEQLNVIIIESGASGK